MRNSLKDDLTSCLRATAAHFVNSISHRCYLTEAKCIGSRSDVSKEAGQCPLILSVRLFLRDDVHMRNGRENYMHSNIDHFSYELYGHVMSVCESVCLYFHSIFIHRHCLQHVYRPLGLSCLLSLLVTPLFKLSEVEV